jgi:hypothetical protein
MSLRFAPQRNNPSNALRNNRSVMNSLNRETTMPKRFPAALRLPSVILIRTTDDGESCLLFSFSVTPSLRGEIVVDPLKSSQIPG